MIYLERHQTEDNLHRYYALEISRDLFGRWLLTRQWGRIGAKTGQNLTVSFDDENTAAVSLERTLQDKVRRGYASTGLHPVHPD